MRLLTGDPTWPSSGQGWLISMWSSRWDTGLMRDFRTDVFNLGCILCNREEPNLTTSWICFFYFNLCFPLLLFTKRLLSIRNGLPRGTLPLCLNGKPKCLCSGKHPDSVHLWTAARKKKFTHPLPESGHSWGYLQTCGLFTLLPLLLPVSVL